MNPSLCLYISLLLLNYYLLLFHRDKLYSLHLIILSDKYAYSDHLFIFMLTAHYAFAFWDQFLLNTIGVYFSIFGTLGMGPDKELKEGLHSGMLIGI